MKHFLKYITLSVVGVLLAAGVSSAWTVPVGSPPTNNISAPINVSSSTQNKLGALGLNILSIFQQGQVSTSSYSVPSSLLFGVNGAMGAAQYCDQNGQNCSTSLGGPTGNLPKGAVVAFNLASCPEGWETYLPAAGRTIIGVGQGSGLTNRTLGQTLGEENHTLTIAEMPSHSHTISGYRSGSNGVGGLTDIWSSNDGTATAGAPATAVTGGNQSHNNMQPSVVLLYCQKSSVGTTNTPSDSGTVVGGGNLSVRVSYNSSDFQTDVSRSCSGAWGVASCQDYSVPFCPSNTNYSDTLSGVPTSGGGPSSWSATYDGTFSCAKK